MTMKAEPVAALEPRWDHSVIVEQDDGMAIIALVWPERPFTMNEARTWHHATWSKEVSHWRDAFTRMAAGCPRLLFASLTIHHEVARRQWPDTGACAAAVKAALDGCCDRVDRDGIAHRGILESDGPKHVHHHIYLPPTYTGRYALTLEFRGLLDTSTITDSTNVTPLTSSP